MEKTKDDLTKPGSAKKHSKKSKEDKAAKESLSPPKRREDDVKNRAQIRADGVYNVSRLTIKFLGEYI